MIETERNRLGENASRDKIKKSQEKLKKKKILFSSMTELFFIYNFSKIKINFYKPKLRKKESLKCLPTLPKPHPEIQQCSRCYYHWYGCNFTMNKIFQFVICLWPTFKNLSLQVSPDNVIIIFNFTPRKNNVSLLFLKIILSKCLLSQAIHFLQGQE